MTTSPTTRKVFCCYRLEGEQKTYYTSTIRQSKKDSQKALETDMGATWRTMRKTMNVDVELVDVFVVKHES